MSVAFAAIQSLEISAWPDLEHKQVGDWRLRWAAGFSGRANSATALVAKADLADADITDIEAFYASYHLPALIRITPFVAETLDARLAERGYATKSASQYRLVSLEAAQPVEAALIHADRASGDWIADFGRLNGRVDFNPATMKAMLEQITARTTFASLIDDGRPVGVGMGVIQDGLIEVQSIAVDPSARGRGLGRRLVGGLLAWGHSQGATAAILSVEATNTPATRLYASLGFTEIAGYHYRIKLPA
jgi:ribosomal protein S18 acetylase RimI-like enzyme